MTLGQYKIAKINYFDVNIDIRLLYIATTEDRASIA
jgi:hypothetical protein